MAGIFQKIEDKFKGGKKEGEKHEEHKGEGHAQFIKPEHGYDEHKPEHGYGQHKPEHKEGLSGKINDKIHGEGGKEKKKKKKKIGKKNKEHGDRHGDSSSSSDSDRGYGYGVCFHLLQGSLQVIEGKQEK